MKHYTVNIELKDRNLPGCHYSKFVKSFYKTLAAAKRAAEKVKTDPDCKFRDKPIYILRVSTKRHYI